MDSALAGSGVLDHLQSEHGHKGWQHSEVELGSSPVSAGGVVPDFVVSSVSDPVGQGAVRVHLLRIAALLTESLDGSHLFNLLIFFNIK